jgi:hypothetical protein
MVESETGTADVMCLGLWGKKEGCQIVDSGTRDARYWTE